MAQLAQETGGPHFLGLHKETDDSGLDQFVLVEGYAASVLLKNQQLMTNSLDWGMVLLNLSDLN